MVKYKLEKPHHDFMSLIGNDVPYTYACPDARLTLSPSWLQAALQMEPRATNWKERQSEQIQTFEISARLACETERKMGSRI